MPSIAMKPVASSQIQSIGYDAATSTLAIRFTRNNGRTEGPGPLYHYQNVSAQDFVAFRDAESAGRHFGQHIKPFHDKYPFVRIDESEKVEPAAEGEAA